MSAQFVTNVAFRSIVRSMGFCDHCCILLPIRENLVISIIIIAHLVLVINTCHLVLLVPPEMVWEAQQLAFQVKFNVTDIL